MELLIRINQKLQIIKLTYLLQRMARIVKKVTYNTNGDPIDCVFCRIHRRMEPGKIEYEDDEFVVFHTKRPATKMHLLVTPKEHIKNMSDLSGPEDAKLIQKMVDIGNATIDRLKVQNSCTRFCFHLPPL